MDERKIVVEHINPPIKIRQCDWCAWFDGDEEVGPWGYGENERAAIKDLMEVLQDQDE